MAMLVLLRRVFNLDCNMLCGHGLFVAAGIGAMLAPSVACEPEPGLITDQPESTCMNRVSPIGWVQLCILTFASAPGGAW